MKKPNGNLGAIPFTTRSVSKLRPFLSIAGCVAVTVAGFLLGDRLVARGSGGNFGLNIDPAELKLGDCWAQNGLRRTLHIKNYTWAPLEIMRFTPAKCNCLTFDPDTVSIPARQTRAVEVSLNLAGRSMGEGIADGGERIIDFAAVLRGAPVPARWQFTARPSRALTADTGVVRFEPGELNARNGSYRPRTVRFIPAPSVAAVEAICDSHLARVVIDRDYASSPGGDYLLRVTPAENLPLGPFEFEIAIHARIEEKLIHAGDVIVAGVVVDEIEFVPSQARFGAVNLGSQISQQVVLRSRTRAPFRIMSCHTDVEGIVARCGGSAALSHTQVVQLRQTALSVGSQGGDVTFSVSYDGESPRDLVLQATYHGVDRPEISRGIAHAEEK